MQLRKADALTGALLILLGLVVYRETLKFPRGLPSVQASGWLTGPWLIPGAAALVLAAMGAGLLVFALLRGGGWSREDVRAVVAAVRRAEFRRILLVMGLLVLYIAVMMGHMHFTLATFLFLALFMGAFRAGAPVKVLLVSGAGAVVVSWVFHNLARVPLP